MPAVLIADPRSKLGPVSTTRVRSFTLASVAQIAIGSMIGGSLGCGAHSVEPTGTQDAGQGGDSLGVGEIDDADNVLRAVSPLPSNDQRLATFGSGMQGTPGDGWDLCRHGLSRAPTGCATCPPPASGMSYLRYIGLLRDPDCVPNPGRICPPVNDSQIYASFMPPIATGMAQGLWFELVHIDGDPSDATLKIYATDDVCRTLEPLGTWSLAHILSGGPEWKTACVTLNPSTPLSNIGFSFSGSQVDLGFEAPRFGPTCPAPLDP